jgi:hypothetical protein
VLHLKSDGNLEKELSESITMTGHRKEAELHVDPFEKESGVVRYYSGSGQPPTAAHPALSSKVKPLPLALPELAVREAGSPVA